MTAKAASRFGTKPLIIGNIDFDWTPPADLKTAAKIRSGGYCVEGAVPLEFVKKFLIQETAHSGHSVYFGAYRAEFSRKDG